MVRMNNTINILKEDTFTDMLSVIGKVAKDILEPYSETDDRQLRQKYGDHLSDIGAPRHLTTLLRRLVDIGMETRDGWLGMSVVRSVFWNYADASLKMARDLGRSGSLKIMLNDLDTCGTGNSKNEVKSESRSRIVAFMLFSYVSVSSCYPLIMQCVLACCKWHGREELRDNLSFPLKFLVFAQKISFFLEL